MQETPAPQHAELPLAKAQLVVALRNLSQLPAERDLWKRKAQQRVEQARCQLVGRARALGGQVLQGDDTVAPSAVLGGQVLQGDDTVSGPRRPSASGGRYTERK